MTASDHCSSQKTLASRGPSTHEAALLADQVRFAGLCLNLIGHAVEKQSHLGVRAFGRHATAFNDPLLDFGEKFQIVIHGPKTNLGHQIGH
jgi:hypothetical protein